MAEAVDKILNLWALFSVASIRIRYVKSSFLREKGNEIGGGPGPRCCVISCTLSQLAL